MGGPVSADVRARPAPDVVVMRRTFTDCTTPPDLRAARFPALKALRRLALTRSGTFCVETTDPVIALTYDDGPDPVHTPRILDVLAARGARATFFMLADAAERHPGIIRRILADGHELGLHGPDHTRLTSLSTAEALRRVVDSRARLEAVAGAAVRLFRPPYGDCTTAQLRAITAEGLEVISWSCSALDWLHDDEEAIAANAIRSSHPGGIMLLHDTRADPETLRPGETLPAFDRAGALAILLASLDERGFETLHVSRLTARYPRVRTFSRAWLR